MTSLFAALCIAQICVSYPLPSPDWLVTPTRERSSVVERRGELILDNGLVSRTIRLAPNAATVDITNHNSGSSVLRGVKPEAVVVLDGKEYEIGGLKGQPDYAYLDPAWLKDMKANPDAFQFVRSEVGNPDMPYPWKPARNVTEAAWPPKGAAVTLYFRPPDGLKDKYEGLQVLVHYEIYDGIPVIIKKVSVDNGSTNNVTVEGMECEILAVNEEQKNYVHVESEYAFNTMVTTAWVPDPEYLTQVDYLYQSPILLKSRYPMGPGVVLKPGEQFDSFRTFELFHDSDDRDRRGLARRRMFRVVAPNVLENPIFMHVRQSDSKALRLAVDQCAEVGFEMVIMTFGSGFDIESEDPAYIARIKGDIDYAHGKGVEVGGYTLMCASRDVGPENNCISPETGQPGSMFGQSACLASEWADGYVRRVLNFMDATGLSMIETDGPFHGDKCASTKHAHHSGLNDSQLAQWKACVNFYHECRKRGIFINTPDNYQLAGSNKNAIGYRETNFSLPRWQQILIARQNIFDATYEKTPSMGWMFVPLVEYHGGGAAATLEPLSEHLVEYEWYLAQNFGCGVQACYRGPRLFDTDKTKVVVKKWVDFYKKYRPILESDLIHVRRADGKGLDCMMHVNPGLEERALIMVFNPTAETRSEKLRIPLYYSGLTKKAAVREQEMMASRHKLSRDYTIELPVKLAPKAITWFVVE